eukprot:INCI5593.3.p1 GENE.INCI5593.3~~INCI5593.3.p1  ORF type:complete len:360 (+),score=48.84 INCI5593.3:299-1378(+)
MATAYQKRAGLLALVLVVSFVGLQGYFFWWEATVEEESFDHETVAGHEPVEVSAHRGSSVLAGRSGDLRAGARDAPSALRAEPLASTEPQLYDPAVDLSRSPSMQHKFPASRQSGVACGLNRPIGERGFISTFRISDSISAKYCGVDSNPSFAPLGYPSTKSDREDAAVNLFVGVTSPCGNVEFRDKRRREFLSAAAGFPADARYLFFVGMCGGDGTGAEAISNDDIDAELVAHGDVVLLSFLDTYHNLTLKSIAVFTLGQHARYAASTESAGPPSYILKVEDYMRNSWSDVQAVVQERIRVGNNNAAPDLYYGGGAIFFGGKIFRRGRWGCSETHCPEETFPTRCVTHKCASVSRSSV